jgi:hypothetical protein
MQLISERYKIDQALKPQALNNTNVTGAYFSMAGFERALAVLNVATLAATKTAKIELLEAHDSDGTSAAAISGKAATITANTLVTEATVDLASVANTDVVTINGLDFTKAAATDASAREFADAAGLETCVEDEDYGVPGVEASVNGNVVTLAADPLGDAVITVSKTENAGTITLATTEALAYVELENFDVSTNADTHIAAKVTVTDASGNCTVSVALLRGKSRQAISQKVGASAA